ncbi:alpha/beta fold hydrolase [Microbacterium gorillae]|uniref:alpha/beta fold hydrolase n=1 Tax=Microbacterium gorillae TaxID=1231063 RepID=UPI000A753CAE|nr:alpha/beta hydrolase [Microbacterium gorillae]
MIDDATGEFDFLAAQARNLDVPVPTVRRLTRHDADGATVSALAFTDDPPVVTMLHGAGLNAHTFDTTLLALERPALAIDIPGHGDSSWRDDADYRPATLAPAVSAAISEWTSSPQVLVGHSLGGMTASRIAAERPELVSHLILVDIVPGIDRTVGPAALRAFYGVVDFPSREAVVEHALSFGLGGERAAAERGVFLNTRVRADGSVEWKHHFARIAHAILPDATTDDAPSEGFQDATIWADLDAVTAPITLIRGAGGFIDDAALARFRERLPHARVLEIGTGHNVQETDPVGLAAAIRAIADAA